MNNILSTFAVGLVAMLVFAANITTAEARPPYKKVTERTFERSHDASRSRVTFDTRRGPATKTTDRIIDQDAGTATRIRSFTGPKGQTANGTRHYQRTENGYTGELIYTDAQGRTGSRSASATAEEGALTRIRGANFRNGESASLSETVKRTDDGFTRNREFSTSTGRGGALNVTGVRTDNGGTIDKVITNDAGEVVGTKSTSVINDDDSASRITTFTGKDGETKTITRKIDK